jgi:hypothetical protein
MAKGLATGRIMLKRAFVLLGPLVGFVLYLVFIGRNNAVPRWAPWALAAYFVFALLVSAAFPGQLSAIGNSESVAALRGHSRTVWKVMLFFYIFAFLAGSISVALLRNTLPLRYLLIPLIFNLVFILLFCWILFWRGSAGSIKGDVK